MQVGQTLKHRRLRSDGTSAEASIKALRVKDGSEKTEYLVSYDFLAKTDGGKTLRVNARDREVPGPAALRRVQ